MSPTIPALLSEVSSDPWFWISLVCLTGWAYFIAIEAPRRWWRAPSDLRRRIDNVLGRLFVVKAEREYESDRGFQFSSFARFCETASEVLLRSLAEEELKSRGVPPEVFAARRGRKDFDA